MNKAITFMVDTPPLKNKGSGISVLLYNILTSLQGQYVLNVLTFCRETDADAKEIEQNSFEAGYHVYIFDKNIERLYRVVRFGLLQKCLQFFVFLLSIPSVFKRYNNSDNTIFTVVGASVRPVIKAWLLMQVLKKPKHSLYIVDDLELINQKLGNKVELFLISLFLKRTIKQADVLVTISEGLKELYFNKYSKSSQVLLPHFKKAARLPSKTLHTKEFIFIYTGGLNLLYNNSLKMFASAIEQLNSEANSEIVFKLIVQTYSSYTDFESLNFDERFVSYSTTSNREEILNVYKNGDCFLIPYSFAVEDRGLVTTSFPQKVAEIIQYGKKVLVFAPEYSSVAKFFVQNKLSHVCKSTKIDELQTSIRVVSSQNIDDCDYTNAYEAYLSSNAIRSAFARLKF